MRDAWIVCDGAMKEEPMNTGTKSYLSDMDGVLVRGNIPIPGAAEFIERLVAEGHPFLILTNNSMYTQRDLQLRLSQIGLPVPAEHIYTSALATAQFLHSQRPGGTAYVIGEAGLTTALHEVGYLLTDHNPDYVVVGETTAYSFEHITRAVRLVAGGARFIATNRDVNGPSSTGIVPATGAIAALIATATGIQPYFIGKPNPLMMRTALNTIDAHSESSMMIGDNMETDIIAGMESGMETVLVLTGVTQRADVERYSFRPTRIVDSIADVLS